MWQNSLRPDVTNPVSYVCVAAPISSFWALNGLDELLEMRFKFVFNLYTGKLAMFFFKQANHSVYYNNNNSNNDNLFNHVIV